MTCTQDNLESLALAERDIRDVIRLFFEERTLSQVYQVDPHPSDLIDLAYEFDRVLARERLVLVRLDDVPEYDEFDDYEDEGEE